MLLKQNQMKSIKNPFCLNICRVRLKQNRYPVLLLTQGVNNKYDDYPDPRTKTIENGSSYVAMAEILGMMIKI
jgi:hypothetical protein